MRTPFTEMVGAEHPLAGFSRSPGVVAAVTNADGLGVLAASFSGENIAELLDVAFSHRIALVANALGTPPPFLVERAKREGVPVAALVGEAKHALRQVDAGVDLLV